MFYSSSDLNLLQSVLDDILNELADGRGPDLVSDSIGLKVRLATALFEASNDGERDYSRLRQHALASVFSTAGYS